MTPAQRRALESAREVLDDEAAGVLPPEMEGATPEQVWNFWLGAYRHTVRSLVKAFGDQS